MDDEEEDMSRPISQLWGTPFRDLKYEERATQIAAGQALAAVTAAVIGINTLPCGLHRQPRIPFHGYALGPVPFLLPNKVQGEDDRMAERPEEQAGVSVEAQIGRKLREIGDKNKNHMETSPELCHDLYTRRHAPPIITCVFDNRPRGLRVSSVCRAATALTESPHKSHEWGRR
uniref:Uncharacterized protein n=1 Tax=Cyclopterus lumpus TaxID=8103 RepID=A0A8C3AH06_CYCLU